MKLRLLLSIFFVIVTTLSAVHEIEHIVDDESCLVCHVNDNLTSADVVVTSHEIKVSCFNCLNHNSLVFLLHTKNRSNPNRAPPTLS